MKLSHYKATDSFYIHLSDRPAVDSDEAADGALVGIDVQHASQKAEINTLIAS